jgi:hypothetical protein
MVFCGKAIGAYIRAQFYICLQPSNGLLPSIGDGTMDQQESRIDAMNRYEKRRAAK